MSALLGIYTAIAALLDGDATLSGLVSGRIYNRVPEGVVYPYVLIGSGREIPWNTLGGRTQGLGYDDRITVHIFSRYNGDLEALQILSRVNALMNQQPIAVSGFTSALLELDQAHVLVEQVDKLDTRHIPAVYRIRVM